VIFGDIFFILTTGELNAKRSRISKSQPLQAEPSFSCNLNENA
jgi:hypothetical protein